MRCAGGAGTFGSRLPLDGPNTNGGIVMKTKMRQKTLAAGLATGLVALGLVMLGSTAHAQAATPDVAAAKFWETGASVHWNRRAIQLFRARGGGPGRVNAYLSIAQYRAVLAAQADNSGPPHASPAAAAAGASVVVLKQFYALDAATLEDEIATQRSGPRWPGEQQNDFAKGEAIGRQVGAAVLAEAATDGFGALDPGAPPVGPAYWISSGAPIVRGGYGARPFFLTYGGELLAPPPPAFGTAAYLAALAEVRAISDTRTAEQLAIARRWVPFSGPVFDLVATDLIVKYRRSELEAARILAYANAAAYDAIIGCFYTKFHYWFVRPSQADNAITLPVGLPNHPSYPSAHSCETGAFQVVLSDAFPAERDMLAGMAAEANVSRIYAGLHYRFDGMAGLEIGREAGRLALERKGLEQ
jgi:membrane-associated phospholipid phosphatase